MILPPKRNKNIGQSDKISLDLLQNMPRSTVVPSLRFKDGKLYVFNCNHTLNPNEMLQSSSQLKNRLTEKGMDRTAEIIFNSYEQPVIPSQCPRCLLQNIEKWCKNNFYK